ncbi:MAG: hypothetical protein MUO82_10745 [Candidatus Thermoplasmatota archaeon]|nr:hypothetical protein [Candidatus Thermoplasmatota archaeon]
MEKNKKVENKISKTEQKDLVEKTSKIQEVDYCVMLLGTKSLQIIYKDRLYLTNLQFVVTKIKDDVAHISLGLMTKDGIDNDVNAWLTKKGKALYFSPEKDVLLVSSVSSLEKILAGELDKSNFGVFN